MIYDCHCHLDYFKEKELDNLIKNAKKNKVKSIITNSTDLKSCEKNLEILEKYEIVKLACGLYPSDKLNLKNYQNFEKFVLKNKNQIIAIGEIGMDFKEGKNFRTQEQIFKKQLELAQKLNLPAIIHSRKAETKVIEIIKNYPNLIKIMHCFCGKLKLISQVDDNTYFSIPTNVVRSEHFQKMLLLISKDKILTETDSPFLSPYKDILDNEPSFIKESIKIISKIWRLSRKQTEKIIEKNFKCVFKNKAI